MARIFTTPAAEQAAKRWLALVTVAGGVRTDPNLSNVGDMHYRKYATDICDELVNRNFNNIDKSIHEIAYYGFHVPGRSKTVHLKPEQVAKAIIYMAEQIQLYWDDTVPCLRDIRTSACCRSTADSASRCSLPTTTADSSLSVSRAAISWGTKSMPCAMRSATASWRRSAAWRAMYCSSCLSPLLF